MSVASEYFEYTKKYQNEYGEKTLVLMQVGSFFEVYAYKDDEGKLCGSKIEDFSLITDFVISQKKQFYKKKPVFMAGFGVLYTDKNIKKLQQAEYTIIMVTQDIQGKNTTRSVSEIITPGTYFSRESEQLSNNTMCISIEYNKQTSYCPETLTYGIAIIDIFTGKTLMHQFNSTYYHNPCTYDELERQVAINQPSECIIRSNLDNKILKDIITYVKLDNIKIHIIDDDKDTSITKMSKNACKQIYQKEVFEKYFPMLDENIYLNAIQKTHDIAAISFILLLEFITQCNPDLTSRLNEPIFDSNDNRLILANHSLKQLNILQENKGNKYDSIGTLLNNCITCMGKRQFMYNLHNPITNKDILNKSYNVTEEFLKHDGYDNNNECFKDYRNIMSGIKDTEKLKRKIIYKKITPKDLYVLYDDLNKILNVCNKTKKNKLIHDYCCKKTNPIKECKKIISELKNTFNIEKCLKIDDLNTDKLSNLDPKDLDIIKKGVNEHIDDHLKDCLDSRIILDAIQNKLSSMISMKENKKNTSSYVKLHTTNKSDPMLIITSRRRTLLKSYIESMNTERRKINIEYKSYDETIKTITLDLNEITYSNYNNNNNSIIISSKTIDEIITKVQKSIYNLIDNVISFLNDYNKKILGHIDSLHIITSYITEIDILQCKSYTAHKYNLCKPEIKTKSKKAFISFTKLRHLLVEQLNTDELYVTNDLTLGTNKKNDYNGLLLYGTNAVGKTCFIKSIGIAVVMAQSGLYVPCSTFRFSPYTAIFTRILGNDNLFKGLSTFAVEMSELNTIINLSDENSLILGDELCSGTESDSALSIFTTGLEDLHKKKSTFLFATHFHEVADYDEVKNLNKLILMHMTVKYDKKTNKLIYDRKLKEGSGETMYGLEVCKSLNIPEEFLARAHDIRIKYNTKKNNILINDGSNYNKKKIKKKCELCGVKLGDDIHHLQYQKYANESNDYINTFNKNHPANLINICDTCHNNVHKNDIQYKKVKTTTGYDLEEI